MSGIPRAACQIELLEAKFRPPPGRPGIVPRTALVGRLLAARRATVVSVVAPPGYGKTTLLAQYAARAGRPLGCVSVDWHDNDPAIPLTYIAVALDRIEAIDPNVFHAPASSGAVVTSVLSPSWGAGPGAGWPSGRCGALG